MSRTLRRIAALIALAALCFAQLAISAYACPKGLNGTAYAQATAEAGTESCPDRTSPNLCERHCDYGSTSVAANPMTFPAPDLAPLPWGVAIATPDDSSPRVPARDLARGGAPPFPARPTPLRI